MNRNEIGQVLHSFCDFCQELQTIYPSMPMEEIVSQVSRIDLLLEYLAWDLVASRIRGKLS